MPVFIIAIAYPRPLIAVYHINNSNNKVTITASVTSGIIMAVNSLLAYGIAKVILKFIL